MQGGRGGGGKHNTQIVDVQTTEERSNTNTTEYIEEKKVQELFKHKRTMHRHNTKKDRTKSNDTN